MGLGTFLGGSAVKELLRLSPQIITTARQLYTTVNRNRQQGEETGNPLNERISRLEAAAAAQAELLEQMAQQLQAQITAVELVTGRNRALIRLAAASLAISTLLLVALILHWR